MKAEKNKNTGTFLVQVVSDQDSTWKGTVTWVDEQKTQNFRSALELIKLIDNALKNQEQKN